ncbi:MAG: ABC transporter permease [Chitinophagaceae bacterium]|nr:ABC transporter permease [Chitinophagaceae bacterium]
MAIVKTNAGFKLYICEMFGRTLEIVASSFRMAVQELLKNKLRTFLSLFGVTIGIFCIIGVLATVNSLEQNIQNEIRNLGTNTIYIDKWDYGAGSGSDYPWWKYQNRPSPQFKEAALIKERSALARYVAFKMNVTDKVEYEDNELSGVNIYGISEDFSIIQNVELAYGRYFSDEEFNRGSPVTVIGHQVSEKLFGEPEKAIGKSINVRGKYLTVTGIIKKQGNTILGGWQFDQSILTPYRFARNIMEEKSSSPVIMVQGKNNIDSRLLKDELTGVMRAIHKLPPLAEDDFTLNDINDFSSAVSSLFVSLNIGGWAIAALSLIVGMFGVANIMFVSVRERTSQIGLKKAIGAKNSLILTEFLLESAFLCILGGLIGLALVFILTRILSGVLNFPVYISVFNFILAITVCIIVGILAGYIPARQAAGMDPVVAIRSR